MRRLFVVLAKVIGLLQIYWGLTYLSSVGFFVGQMARLESSEFWSLLIQAGSLAGFALLTFGVAWLLLVRTEWVADWVRIERDEALPAVTADVVLRAGTKLAGIYILANSVPGLLRAAAEVSLYTMWEGQMASALARIVPAVLQVALGWMLAVQTGLVLRLVERGERVGAKRSWLGCLALLAVLILLGRGLVVHPWIRNRAQHSGDQGAHGYAGRGTIESDGGSASDDEGWPMASQPVADAPEFATAAIPEIAEFLRETPRDDADEERP